jgi:hypothetical protein
MGKPPDRFLTGPSAELTPLLRAAALGDADAARFFAELFPPDAPCVLCDGPIGTKGTSYVLPDPAMPKMSLMMPVCDKCTALPPKDRRVAELNLARQMWPRIRWKPQRGNDPAYLRRGGPPKAKHHG